MGAKVFYWFWNGESRASTWVGISGMATFRGLERRPDTGRGRGIGFVDDSEFARILRFLSSSSDPIPAVRINVFHNASINNSLCVCLESERGKFRQLMENM